MRGRRTIVAFGIVLLLGYPTATALTVAASLAQISEFSFILAGLGLSMGLLPPEGRAPRPRASALSARAAGRTPPISSRPARCR